MQNKLFLRVLFFVLAGSMGLLFLYAQTDFEPKVAPLNPAFLYAIDDLRNGRSYKSAQGLGGIPSPVDISYYVGIHDGSVRAGYAPSYDLRNFNKVTSVKNQGNCGTCWTFGAFGSLESSLLPGENKDFAEIDLARKHGFDYAECAGGNTNMSQAYLARWAGPYNETDYPYPYSSLADLANVQKHVQKVIWLPARTSSTDNDTIKWFLTNYGAITFGFYWEDSYFNSTNKSYYFPSAHYINHEICFIGWDDNFDKSKFVNTPAGNGAFLCKNSWGTSWGDGGYFWISYYDATISDIAMFHDAQSITNYKNIYQYDPLGVTHNFGNGTLTFWGANVFEASTSDPLNALSFVVNDSCSVTYYIYKNPAAGNPSSGTLMSSGSIGAYSYAGYYTYNLPSPVSLTLGDKFSIVIKYSNASYKYPLPIEGYISGYSTAATNAAGQSYYSSNGSSWTDFAAYNSNSYRFNCTIKAFTSTIPATITVASPNGGESWMVGSSHNVTWTSTGAIANVKIESSTDSGSSYSTVIASTSNTGSYAWTIPSTPSATCLVRVSDAAAASVNDVSDAVFSITAAPTVTVTAPNGGESWIVGSSHNITWTSTGAIANVKIESSTDSGSSYATVIASTSNTGSYAWTIPNAPAATCLVRVSDAAAASVNDVSNAVFSITAAPTVTVTSPNGGESWVVGSSHNITWTSTGAIANVKIESSTDSGSSYSTVIASTSNTGSYAWTIPSTPSATCLVRVSDASNAAVNDASNVVFSIEAVPTITVTSPNGGESWVVGSSHNITWTSTGTIANVKIESSTDSGSSYATVIASTSNTGSYAWTIPSTPSATCLVRVSDASNASINDVSNGTFTITGLPAARKVDFNGDGKEDILWRHYGTGQNAVWFLGGYTATGAALADSILQDLVAINMNHDRAPKVYRDIAEVGGFLGKPVETMFFDPQEALAFNEKHGSGDIYLIQAQMAASGSPQYLTPAIGPRKQTQNIIADSYLPFVTDVNWTLVGTGDFNGDGKIDILWQNYSTGQNAVWFMNGVSNTGSTYLPSVTDLNWKIVGTGDFNSDGQIDILWRNNVTGQNAVWFMNGATYISYAYLPAVTDTNWQIVGTGDLNGDGLTDIIWRNYLTGQNAAWGMNGTTETSNAYLPPVTDTNWRIMGTGDFNGDGKVDIIWRNSFNGENVLWYMNGITYAGYDYLPPVADTQWRISNR